MKILFPLGTLYPSQQGGPSNTIYWMAKALQKKGYLITCIATDLGNPKNAVPSDHWLQTNYGRVIYTHDAFHVFPIKLLWSALNNIPNHQIVHLTSLFYPPSFILVAAALIRKKKVVWSIRGNLEPSALRISSNKKKAVLWFIRLVRHRVLFHSTSHEETKHAKSLLGQNINIVEIPNFMEFPVRQPHRPEKPYFLYLGRLHPIKALDLLLMALASSNFKKSDYQFYLAGEGISTYTEWLKRECERLGIGDQIKFLGQIEGVKKNQLLANGRFTFLVSHAENFGNVVIESLAQGTPVVASTNTPWQILSESQAGFWVNNDPDQLNILINKILQMDEVQYLKYRQNAYDLAHSEFDIKKNVAQWITAYTSL